jgi:type-F conjugative transfer system pilin assembly protein TrbC
MQNKEIEIPRNRNTRMNKNYNKIIYQLAAIALVLLVIIASSARANVTGKQAIEIEPGIYVFVSFSMNDQSLRSYFMEAQHYGAKLVMNGLAGDKHARNRFAETTAKMEKARINVDINPNLFEYFNIKQVPAIIVVNSDKSTKKVSGHISLSKALEIMDVSFTKSGKDKV